MIQSAFHSLKRDSPLVSGLPTNTSSSCHPPLFTCAGFLCLCISISTNSYPLTLTLCYYFAYFSMPAFSTALLNRVCVSLATRPQTKWEETCSDEMLSTAVCRFCELSQCHDTRRENGHKKFWNCKFYRAIFDIPYKFTHPIRDGILLLFLIWPSGVDSPSLSLIHACLSCRW